MIQRDTDKLEFVIQPSQLVNLGWLIIAVVAYFYISPLSKLWWFFPIIYVYYYLIIKNWKYEFRERTIGQRKGVFSYNKIELHYFRIKSIKIERPFLMRLVGLSNLILLTSDPFCPILTLYAIENGEEMRERIKDYTYHWRKEQNITEYDVHPIY